MNDAVAAPEFKQLDKKTVQTIDYIIRGLELGKFDETAKKVEFLGKLAGDNTPQYIATLLARILHLELQVSNLEGDVQNDNARIIQLEMDKNALESRIIKMEGEMTTIATALRQIFEPKPLKNSWEMGDVNTFCNNHGAHGN